ncbi:hypothetical protein NQ318_003986 [Aromia moschata]|uniref:Ig-like domain-containing protein n=1 Tax=Aromia moschata TaxID=1265417 RepID=A0AAV8Z9X2_9CUCU|nr:hypothetical protein NQ318_003986 [Aromia moschata]
MKEKDFLSHKERDGEGEVQTSAYPGRIIVTEPKGPAQPRISVDKYNARRVVLGEDVTLPCVAQGHPVPGYYWKRELQGQSVPVALGERLTVLSAGLLRISKVLDSRLKENWSDARLRFKEGVDIPKGSPYPMDTTVLILRMKKLQKYFQKQ